MIQCSSIDFAAVLKGARVPLCVSTRSVERAEWIGDAAYAMQRGAMDFTRLVSTEANQQQLALDPTDPDVARLLDMRIAERVGVVGFVWARLFTRDGHWSIAYGGAVHRGECGVGHLILNVEPVRANTAIARAALIKALYPRTA